MYVRLESRIDVMPTVDNYSRLFLGSLSIFLHFHAFLLRIYLM